MVCSALLLLLLLSLLVPRTSPYQYTSTSASHRTGRLPYTSEPLGHQEHALLATHDDHAVGTLSVGLRAGSHRVTTAYTVLPPMDSPPRGAHAADEARAEEGAQLAWYTKYASDDAFVADCDMINANFGADRLLETRNFLARACVTRRSFVAFNLEDFSEDVVQRATLRMVAQRFDRGAIVHVVVTPRDPCSTHRAQRPCEADSAHSCAWGFLEVPPGSSATTPTRRCQRIDPCAHYTTVGDACAVRYERADECVAKAVACAADTQHSCEWTWGGASAWSGTCARSTTAHGVHSAEGREWRRRAVASAARAALNAGTARSAETITATTNGTADGMPLSPPKAAEVALPTLSPRAKAVVAAAHAAAVAAEVSSNATALDVAALQQHTWDEAGLTWRTQPSDDEPSCRWSRPRSMEPRAAHRSRRGSSGTHNDVGVLECDLTNHVRRHAALPRHDACKSAMSKLACEDAHAAANRSYACEWTDRVDLSTGGSLAASTAAAPTTPDAQRCVRLRDPTRGRLEIALYAQYHATRRAAFYSREAEQEMTRPRLLLGVRRAPIEGSHIWPDRDYNVREPGPSPSPQAALRGHPTPPMARAHDHLLSLEQEEQAWGHGWAAGESASAAPNGAAANGANLVQRSNCATKTSLAECVQAAPHCSWSRNTRTCSAADLCSSHSRSRLSCEAQAGCLWRAASGLCVAAPDAASVNSAALAAAADHFYNAAKGSKRLSQESDWRAKEEAWRNQRDTDRRLRTETQLHHEANDEALAQARLAVLSEFYKSPIGVRDDETVPRGVAQVCRNDNQGQGCVLVQPLAQQQPSYRTPHTGNGTLHNGTSTALTGSLASDTRNYFDARHPWQHQHPQGQGTGRAVDLGGPVTRDRSTQALGAYEQYAPTRLHNTHPWRYESMRECDTIKNAHFRHLCKMQWVTTGQVRDPAAPVDAGGECSAVPDTPHWACTHKRWSVGCGVGKPGVCEDLARKSANSYRHAQEMRDQALEKSKRDAKDALDAHRMRARYSTSVRFQQDKRAKEQKQSAKEEVRRKQQDEEAARRASSVTPNEDDKKTKYYTDQVMKRPPYQIRDPKPNDDDPTSTQFFTRYGVRYYPNSQAVTTSTGLPK